MKAPEVWFGRVLWSYVPIHWKGWAFVTAHVAAMLCLLGLLIAVAEWLGQPTAGGWLIAMAAIALSIFAVDPFLRRHSRPL